MEEIITLLESGKIAGYEEEIPDVISTGSSHVFIFRKKNIALKLYRRDNEHWNKYFADMSEGEARRSFITLDYDWNHLYSPIVYLGLKQIAIVDGILEFSLPAGSDELIIEMKIVDDASFLMNILDSDTPLTPETYADMGRQVAVITKSDKLLTPSHKTFDEIAKERAVDLMSWIKNLNSFDDTFISALEEHIISYVEAHKIAFEYLNDEDFVNVIDCHSANAVYEAGTISFVDVLLPKELWRTSRMNENFFRIATDVAVLRGEEAYEAYKKGFLNISAFENTTEEFDLIYCASLMLCIQTAYAKKDKGHQPLADKYYYFVQNKLSEKHN
jgi:aminoglycoside phosphotransferase family enzyme